MGDSASVHMYLRNSRHQLRKIRHVGKKFGAPRRVDGVVEDIVVQAVQQVRLVCAEHADFDHCITQWNLDAYMEPERG